jgi:hypothetical protein
MGRYAEAFDWVAWPHGQRSSSSLSPRTQSCGRLDVVEPHEERTSASTTIHQLALIWDFAVDDGRSGPHRDESDCRVSGQIGSPLPADGREELNERVKSRPTSRAREDVIGARHTAAQGQPVEDREAIHAVHNQHSEP